MVTSGCCFSRAKLLRPGSYSVTLDVHIEHVKIRKDGNAYMPKWDMHNTHLWIRVRIVNFDKILISMSGSRKLKTKLYIINSAECSARTKSTH
jgi:hypothetical protein